MLIIGGLILIFGLVDLVGSYTNFDLWTEIGVQLPDAIWRYSAYIEIGVGLLLIKLGKSGGKQSKD